jgi:hypothetical protein
VHNRYLALVLLATLASLRERSHCAPPLRYRSRRGDGTSAAAFVERLTGEILLGPPKSGPGAALWACHRQSSLQCASTYRPSPAMPVPRSRTGITTAVDAHIQAAQLGGAGGGQGDAGGLRAGG